MDAEITLYTPKDIQRIFHCGKRKSYEIMHTPGFPAFRVDGLMYLERTDLEKWIQRQKNKGI